MIATPVWRPRPRPLPRRAASRSALLAVAPRAPSTASMGFAVNTGLETPWLCSQNAQPRGYPWAKKGGPWGACGLNGLKPARAGFKSCWAADSLNGLKRLNGAGELRGRWSGSGPGLREAPGRRRRPGSWLQSASTRPLCEYGSCQCTRLTGVSSEAGLCLITAVLEKPARNPATRAGEADFLKRS